MKNPTRASRMSLEMFVKTKFVPEHVAQKTLAGRTHYYSLLKHVLSPEAVDGVFAEIAKTGNARLKSIPGWPYLDDVRLCDLTPDHVRQLISAAFAHGYSAQTVKHIRNVIGAILSYAIKEQCLSGENPVSATTLPPIVRKRAYNLTIAQIQSVFRLMRYPEREIALITIATGMSISEICGLQWKHVNLGKTVVDIDEEVIPPGAILVKQLWSPGGLITMAPNRIRHAVIPDGLLSALLALRANLRSAVPDDFVLVSPLGKPISPIVAREMLLKPIGRKLDMPWLSWQVLQRTHGSLLTELKPRVCDYLIPGARLGDQDMSPGENMDHLPPR